MKKGEEIAKGAKELRRKIEKYRQEFQREVRNTSDKIRKAQKEFVKKVEEFRKEF